MTKSKVDMALSSFSEELKKNKKKREGMRRDMLRIVFDEFRDNPHVSTFSKSVEVSNKLIEYFLTNKQ